MEPGAPALQRGAACDERILLSPNRIFQPADHRSAAVLRVTPQAAKSLIFDDATHSRPIFRLARRRTARRPLRWNARRSLGEVRFRPKEPKRRRVRKDSYAANSIGHARKTHR